MGKYTNMPIYMIHMNSLASVMWSVVLYTDDSDTNNNAHANNNDDNAACFH